MAMMALLMGSVLGFFGAIAAWLVFDVSLISAVTLYFGTALGFGLLPFVACALRSDATPEPVPAR